MTEKLHPVYETFLWDCFNQVQEKLGTGKIKKEEQLKKYIFALCEFPSAIDAFEFINSYASYSWSQIVSVELK